MSPSVRLCFCAGFSIEGPSQAKIECDDKGDGSCDVRYWPTEPGDYAVHVICDDEDMKDSPFMAHVLPAAGDGVPEKVRAAPPLRASQRLSRKPELAALSAPQVRCYGPGLEPLGCIVNRPAHFTVDTGGAGRAELKIYAQVPTPRLGCLLAA